MIWKKKLHETKKKKLEQIIINVTLQNYITNVQIHIISRAAITHNAKFPTLIIQTFSVNYKNWIIFNFK